MNKKIGVLAVVLAIFLCGCSVDDLLPEARELEDMALMRTLGVDVAANGGDGVLVTAASGIQSQGKDEGSKPPMTLSGEGVSVSAACLSMQAEGASHIFYGHMGQMLLGEALARRGAEPALDYVLRDVESRLDTALFVVRGTSAGAAITGGTEGDASIAQRLDGMGEDGGVHSRMMVRTVKDVLTDLGHSGSAFVPAIAGEKTLAPAGYAVLKDGALIGWVEGGAAEGVNLLLGEVKADLVEVAVDGLSAVLRVVGAKTTVTPRFLDGKLTALAVHCRVDANLAEADSGLNLRQRTALETCQQALEAVEQARLEGALATAQALGADFLGLEKRAGLTAPWHWAELQAQWDVSKIPVVVTVQARILRSYDVVG